MMSFNERCAFDHSSPRPFAFVVGAELKMAVGWGGLASDLSDETQRPRPGRGERVPPGTSGLHFS